jgi:hypothetical protein
MATTSKYPADDSSGDSYTNRRGYWEEQITKANKRWEKFEKDGIAVMDRFMLETQYMGDKYNILYSSTETIKPSLYGQTPKVQVKTRQSDTEDNLKVASAMLLEQVGQYAVDMLDFDYIMQNVVSDYVLPGIGVAWIRYDPQFAPMYSNDNTPAVNDDGTQAEYLTFEGLALDYVHFKDFRTGQARYWHEVPWISRRTFLTKRQATERFGAQKANDLCYTFTQKDKNEGNKTDSGSKQAIIYEIWDKDNKEVVWYSDDYSTDVLDAKADPYRLENFYPCPRPLRAVWSSQSIIPKSLYSQYRTQAAELDRLTERIRYLTEALKVRGLYDGSQENLANLLDGVGNKMVAVQDWANFMGAGGVTGVVQWLPITDVTNCLGELFKQREICKNEIYEITGFSDIVRGISKASETLGAQQLKADWATGRLKDMQREVQRFCRDVIRIFIEIAAEHFSDKTLMLYSGITIQPPSPAEIQAKQQYQQQLIQFQQAQAQFPQQAQQAQMQGQPIPPQPQPPQDPGPTQGEQMQVMFNAVVKLVRQDKLRLAAVGIETDSTILPDEQKERQDRMQFLASMGAFLQQAAPMAMQFPDMRGLLGGIMMFTLRTFSASRPLEKEFETFQKKLEAMPPTPPPGQQDNGQAAAQAAAQVAQMKAQADIQMASQSDATKRYEIDQKTQSEGNKQANEHQFRMAQLNLDQQKLHLETTKTGLNALNDAHNSQIETHGHMVDAIAETGQTLQQQDYNAAQAELERHHKQAMQFSQQMHEAEQNSAERAARPAQSQSDA